MSNTWSHPPQILAFDIFGTVVDWHGSIAREVQACGRVWTARRLRGPGARATSRPWHV